MGTLKGFFSPQLVRRLATDIVRVQPRFPQRAFVSRACSGLAALELLDRGRHIARALAAHLPKTTRPRSTCCCALWVPSTPATS